MNTKKATSLLITLFLVACGDNTASSRSTQRDIEREHEFAKSLRPTEPIPAMDRNGTTVRKLKLDNEK